MRNFLSFINFSIFFLGLKTFSAIILNYLQNWVNRVIHQKPKFYRKWPWAQKVFKVRVAAADCQGTRPQTPSEHPPYPNSDTLTYKWYLVTKPTGTFACCGLGRWRHLGHCSHHGVFWTVQPNGQFQQHDAQPRVLSHGQSTQAKVMRPAHFEKSGGRHRPDMLG